jgi:hypothetical protein
MWRQPPVAEPNFAPPSRRNGARQASSHRSPPDPNNHHPTTRPPTNPRLSWLVGAVICLGAVLPPLAANAQDLADSIVAINNELINDTNLTSGLLVSGPPEVAREVAIVDSSMFDAANAASGLPNPGIAYSGPAVTTANVDVAALQAGYTALKGIFSNQVWAGVPYPTSGSPTLVGGSASIQATVLAEIQNTYATALGNLQASESPTTAAINAAVSLGTAAGQANLAANGYIVTGGVVSTAPDTGPGGSYTQIAAGITNPYVPANSNAGTYVPPSTNPVATAPASNRIAMFPTWGTVQPTGMTSGQITAIEGAVPPPFPLTSQAYANNVLQTECQGAGTALPTNIQSACSAAGFAPETAAQAQAALFWNDPGTTATPPGHWLQIMDSLATQQGLSTLQATQLGALVGEAVDDAGIAAWDVKYTYNLWRPVTAINDCSGWNPYFTTCDPGWSSLIATPPHPDYLAGHPAFSGAAATVLQNFFGTDDLSITSSSESYCNGGSPMRGGTILAGNPTGQIIACVVTPLSSTGTAFLFDGEPTFYGSQSACLELGSLTTDVGGNAACLIGSTVYVFNPSENSDGCNDIVDPSGEGTNDSLLICPITLNFATISDASSGPQGAEFSRVVGGIHTPDAVEQALTLGNAIGQQISANANIPEPGAIGLLATAIGMIGGFRRFRGKPANRSGRRRRANGTEVSRAEGSEPEPAPAVI